MWTGFRHDVVKWMMACDPLNKRTPSQLIVAGKAKDNMVIVCSPLIKQSTSQANCVFQDASVSDLWVRSWTNYLPCGSVKIGLDSQRASAAQASPDVEII